MRVNRRSLLVGALALAARPAAGATPLRVSATPGIFRGMFEELVRAFMARHADIRIELTISGRDQDDQIQTTLRAATINDLPDVSFQGFNYLRVLQERGLAVPLQPFIAGDPGYTAERYAPSVAATGEVAGTIAGLGVGMSFPIIYVNLDLVRAAQDGSATIPPDWDGIVALARRISAMRADLVGGFLQYQGSAWVYMSVLESLGGRLMSADERGIAFDDAAGLRTLALYRAFAEAGQARANLTRDQSRQAFAGGTLGLLIDSSSSLAALERQIGGRFALGTAAMPVAPGGRVQAAGIASVMHTRERARQAAAWAFMRFVSGPEGQAIVGRATGYVPANSIAAAQPALLGEYYRDRPLSRAALDSVRHATGWYAFPGPNAVKITDVIRDHVGTVATLQRTPEEALVAMRRDVAALLPQ